MRSRAQAGARDTLPLQDLTQPLRIAAMGSAELTPHTGLQSRPADARVQAHLERHGVRRGRRAGRSLARQPARNHADRQFTAHDPFGGRLRRRPAQANRPTPPCAIPLRPPTAHRRRHSSRRSAMRRPERRGPLRLLQRDLHGAWRCAVGQECARGSCLRQCSARAGRRRRLSDFVFRPSRWTTAGRCSSRPRQTVNA